MVQEGKYETMSILVIFFSFRFLIELLLYQFWLQSSYPIGTPTFKKTIEWRTITDKIWPCLRSWFSIKMVSITTKKKIRLQDVCDQSVLSVSATADLQQQLQPLFSSSNSTAVEKCDNLYFSGQHTWLHRKTVFSGQWHCHILLPWEGAPYFIDVFFNDNKHINIFVLLKFLFWVLLPFVIQYLFAGQYFTRNAIIKFSTPTNCL